MRIGVGAQDVRHREISLERLLARLRNRLKIAAKDAQARQTSVTPAEAIRERQDQLIEFYRVYEDLCEVLCDGAQYGPTSALETRYVRARGWMHENYGPVRRYIVAYLRYASEDAQQNMEQGGTGADAFEALVAAPNLHEFLEHDDGMMISRLTRTREALNLYGDHLRQLARSVKEA